jgi:hypothetical protein
VTAVVTRSTVKRCVTKAACTGKSDQMSRHSFISAGTVALLLAALQGCGGSTSTASTASTSTVGHAATTVSGISEPRNGARVTIRGVEIEWARSPNGVVCYHASRPGVNPKQRGALRTCVKHLRRDEISFVIAPRHTGQQMIAGLQGDGVSRVTVRLMPRRLWSPRSKAGAFFGYVPRGYRVVAVVKEIAGKSVAFPVAS